MQGVTVTHSLRITPLFARLPVLSSDTPVGLFLGLTPPLCSDSVEVLTGEDLCTRRLCGNKEEVVVVVVSKVGSEDHPLVSEPSPGEHKFQLLFFPFMSGRLYKYI